MTNHERGEDQGHLGTNLSLLSDPIGVRLNLVQIRVGWSSGTLPFELPPSYPIPSHGFTSHSPRSKSGRGGLFGEASFIFWIDTEIEFLIPSNLCLPGLNRTVFAALKTV